MAAHQRRANPRIATTAARWVRLRGIPIINLDKVRSIEPLETDDARLHMREAAVLPCCGRSRKHLRAGAAEA
ncbi:hypothetical protein GCM10023332_17160 [Luteimonas vadosa]|uniref:Uncharacterized protein n=1 Tax=Luteimonas vadosa TaxID=1165507 RepID=A0ABP9E1A1_9GAMM